MSINHSFARAMPIVATALGRKFGVTVTVGGDSAQTDGQTIWLPDLPPESALRSVAWGFLAHEASHVRHTDQPIFQATAAYSPLHYQILNILEDIRIELAIRHLYPGTEATLNSVVDWMLNTGKLNPPLLNDHPAHILTAFLLLHLRAQVLGQTVLLPVAAHAQQVLQRTFPAVFISHLYRLLIEVPQLVNTAAAADLTIRICQLLQTPAATLPAAPPKAKPERDEPKKDQAENNGESTAATHTEAQTGTANSGGGAGVAADDPLQRTLAASADDMAGDLFTATRQALEDVSDNNAFGVLLPVGEAVEIAPQGQQFVRKVQAESRALSAKLQGLVQAKRRDRCYAVPQGNRLLSKRLYRVGMGETRLFARHTERTAPNTAVHLLVDLSGSMHQSLAGSSLGQIAQDAALALALALDAIAGVSVAVTAFPGQSGDSDRVACLMKHGQSPRTQAGAFTQSARGGTPLAQGLWYAAADLMLRTETRRMVLVITDGQPNDPKGALDIIRQCEQAGMMVVGIGIGCDVSALFAHHILIKTVSDLQHTLFELTEQFLV